MRWLSRRGLLRDPAAAHDSNAPREVSPAEALAAAGMQRGNLVTVRERDDGADENEPSLARPPPRVSDAVTHERFNLHATVHIEAHDDLGRERLCRYLNRPAFSLARLGVRRDGNVSYRVKKASGITSSLQGRGQAQRKAGDPRRRRGSVGRHARQLTEHTLLSIDLVEVGGRAIISPR